MAILIIAFLTVTISAAYTATSSELTTNMAQRGESKSYMIAQAGLENFRSDGDPHHRLPHGHDLGGVHRHLVRADDQHGAARREQVVHDRAGGPRELQI